MSEPSIRVEQILKQVGLLDDVTKQQDLLVGIVKYVSSQDIMDKDTILYRLAMTIYHSRSFTNQSLIPSLDDPGAVYLKALETPRLQALITEMTQRYSAIPVVELVKTFMCFVIAAFIIQSAS